MKIKTKLRGGPRGSCTPVPTPIPNPGPGPRLPVQEI
jgi:hypothetical protein